MKPILVSFLCGDKTQQRLVGINFRFQIYYFPTDLQNFLADVESPALLLYEKDFFDKNIPNQLNGFAKMARDILVRLRDEEVDGVVVFVDQTNIAMVRKYIKAVLPCAVVYTTAPRSLEELWVSSLYTPIEDGDIFVGFYPLAEHLTNFPVRPTVVRPR